MTNNEKPVSVGPVSQATQEWHEAIERFVLHARASRREPSEDVERQQRQEKLRRELAEKYEAYRSALERPPP
jgi:hypothetical protein